ncbi:polysaccharide deacetylase family protein [Sphingosinicella terrae]|uniref:polysaccharide deacetylase family protein n=1 Tax=Sphingosinicella terrae TaxID=2172047 RepID=UPI000E0D19B5|nr:polysaccharide deacetylase family protein [Sphingosinicella terrae]
MTPRLAIVVDTEEEFDWDKPFSRTATATRSIPAQAHAHRLYDRFDIVPTYVVDYPVATNPAAADFLGALVADGRAEIGAHLHPWVTPPHEEEVTRRNSYHCNLPPALERAKIETITAAIRDAFGTAPIVFKAGRYGFGPSTLEAIAALGYQVDCSGLPHTDLRGDGGPDFRGTPDEPYWLDRPGGILEVPLTIGFFGAAAGFGPRLEWLFDSPRAARLHLPGLLARSRLIARSRLTPEGVSAREQCRLIESMVRRGHRTFTLAYHSPSLEPGHTPYVRSEAQLQAFLDAIEQVLHFFRDRIGGTFTTLTRIRGEMMEARRAA